MTYLISFGALLLAIVGMLAIILLLILLGVSLEKGYKMLPWSAQRILRWFGILIKWTFYISCALIGGLCATLIMHGLIYGTL